MTLITLNHDFLMRMLKFIRILSHSFAYLSVTVSLSYAFGPDINSNIQSAVKSTVS